MSLLITLLLILALPASAHTPRYRPDQKPALLQELGQLLLHLGWNCETAIELTVVEPDHYGDVLKVTCQSATLLGERRSFTFRVTHPKGQSLDAVRVEPWKEP